MLVLREALVVMHSKVSVVGCVDHDCQVGEKEERHAFQLALQELQ